MARPLRKTYRPTHPYVVERHDEEDGSITYEVWDHRPDSYRRLCSINENNESETYSDDDRRPEHCAKSDAEMIVRALNLMNGGTAMTHTAGGVTALDLAWERINALGGCATNETEEAINETVGHALDIIEALGGSDPAAKRALWLKSQGPA